MATTLDERRQKPTTRPAAAMDLGMVDGAAPLNLTRPGTMRPDAPKPVPTQPAPQFDLTNAGPMLRQPPAPVPPAPAVDLNQQRMANQSAMYVQGAQAAAAARPPSPVQQMVDSPMSAPVRNSINAAVAPPKPATPSRIGINTMNQRAYAESEARKTAANPTGSIYGMAAPAAQMADVPAAPRQPLDAQAAADARMFGRAWDATKDGFQRAGAAIADVATLPVRAAAGAYDTAVIRPMRAAGIPAGYMSPMVNPASNADGQSMTPFYDQFRARDEMTQAATAYGNEGRRTPAPIAPAVNPAGPRATNEAQAKNPASDQGQVPGAAAPMPQGAQPAGPANDFTATKVPGVYRKGNTFTDEAGTRDTAFLNRGAITPQNQNAAEQLAANYNSNQQALARFQAANPAPQPTQAAAPRQFDRAASIRALSDLRSPEAIALRNLRVDAQEEARDSARLGRAGRGNNAAGQAYAALLGELTSGTRQGQTAEMQDAGATLRTGMQEAGATGRTAMTEGGNMARAVMTNEVQQGELGVKREAQSLTRERDQRLRKAEDDFLNETDPAKREAKARTLQALMGKGDGTPAGKDRYITLGGGSRVENGFTVTEPQRVFDTATGREIGAGPAAAAQVPPAAIDMLKKNPGMAAQFDQKFGPGASARYLNQ